MEAGGGWAGPGPQVAQKTRRRGGRGGLDGAEEGGSQPRALRAARPCPAPLAELQLQLQALPAAAPLLCPGPSAAIEMEMPRAWRAKTPFPA